MGKFLNSKKVIIYLLLIVVFIYPLFIIKDNITFPMSSKEVIYNLGKYFAFLAYFIFFLQYIWTAKIKTIEHIFPFDTRVAIHRSMGFIGLITVSLHPIMVLLFYANIGVKIIVTPYLGLGFLAFFLVLIIGLSTFLGKMLSVKYETWKAIHWITFFILTLAFIHSLFLGTDLRSIHRVIWICLWGIHILIVVVKLLHNLIIRSRTYIIEEVVVENPTVTTIKLHCSKTFKPGQFAFVSIFLDGKWQSWHPFSISSRPESDLLTFTIKKLGDMTERIPEIKKGDKIKVDLSYGGFSNKFYPDNKYVFIAGGVGITPIYSMISSLSKERNRPDITLLYSVHNEDEILFKEDLEEMFSENHHWHIKYIMSSQKDWNGPQGHITPINLLYLCNYDITGTFFLCGPITMVNNIKRHLKSQGKKAIEVRTEQFSFIP